MISPFSIEDFRLELHNERLELARLSLLSNTQAYNTKRRLLPIGLPLESISI